MNARIACLLAASFLVSLSAVAQDAGGPPPQGQDSQRGGRGGMGGFGGMMGGRGILGTVTAVAPDHFMIKLDSGEVKTINFSVNTRIFRQGAGSRQQDGGQRTPPEPIKAADIKIGDAIAANGEPDGSGKSIGAVLIVQLDPERAKQMREMQANFGKTWIMGKVVSVRETQITVQSPIDSAPHTFLADENTSFRKRRDFITLADVQVGDNVRVEGAVKQGVFTATTVNVMAMPPANGGPQPMRDHPPQ